MKNQSNVALFLSNPQNQAAIQQGIDAVNREQYNF